MDSKLFLAIFLGIWLGMTVYYISKCLIGGCVKYAIDKKERAWAMEERRIRKDNETGRIIGFRPIENERA